MATLERLEGCRIRITMEITPERLEEGIQHAYQQRKNEIFVQGFRRGKAPRKLIEARYGKGVFYEDALDFVLPDAYEAALDEHDARVVSRPDIRAERVDAADGAVLVAEVTVEPEVTLGDYAGIVYTMPDMAVTDEMIQEEIDKQLRKNARILPVEGRPLQLNDTAMIDFEGFMDDVPFEGGKGQEYPLTLGAHNFIDTFEDQLVGHNIGDKVDVHVTFPEDYGTTELAGKPAVFKVVINSASYREIPEPDDDFAQDTSDFDTFDEYKEDLVDKLKAAREEEGRHEIENRVLEKLAARAEMDIPEVMFENEIDSMVSEFQRRVRMSGMPYEHYMAHMGLTPMSLRAQYRGDAERNVRARLALQAVVAQGGFDADDDEVEAEIQQMAQNYGWNADDMKAGMSNRDREGIRRDVQVQKAMKHVVSLAIAEA